MNREKVIEAAQAIGFMAGIAVSRLRQAFTSAPCLDCPFGFRVRILNPWSPFLRRRECVYCEVCYPEAYE